MNFIVCEDNITIAHDIEQLLILMDVLPDNIEVFFSGNDLLKYLNSPQNQVQIFLLDIDLPEINGIEIAHKIRSTDLDSVIIFISGHTEYVRETFNVLTFQFLDKPLDQNNFKKCINNAIYFLNKKQDMFHFHINNNNYCIPQKNILYLEKIKRIVLIHTNDEVYQCYMTVKELTEQLDMSQFIQIHKSYIINLFYLKKIESASVQLTNDETLCLSRMHKNNLKLKLYDYHHRAGDRYDTNF